MTFDRHIINATETNKQAFPTGLKDVDKNPHSKSVVLACHDFFVKRHWLVYIALTKTLNELTEQ